jgi:hypothetical protein
LEDFSFDEKMLSCRNKAQFPDLAIRLNKDKSTFTGGELVEIKESKAYTVSSFNSTIPTGKKKVENLFGKSKNSKIQKQMEEAGDDIFSLLERDVYYLIYGKHKANKKICLIHGSFFETISVEELIRQSFSKVLNAELAIHNLNVDESIKRILLNILSKQESFSKVRDAEKASVSLRLRIQTEVKQEGNILNKNIYPEIDDDTINLAIPFHSDQERNVVLEKMKLASPRKNFKTFNIKHPFNGWFVVFQDSLRT